MTALAFNLLVIRAGDVDASLRFYRALGLKLEPAGYGLGGYTIYRGCVPSTDNPFIDPNCEPIPVCFEIHPVSITRPVTKGIILGLYVSSVDSTVEAVVAVGGQVLSPPVKWPYGRRAAVADPDGNRVELSEDVFGRPTGEYPTGSATIAEGYSDHVVEGKIITQISQEDNSSGESSIRGCQMLARGLQTGNVSLAEYTYNLTLWIVTAPGSYMERCLELVPKAVLAQYLQHLETEVVSVDFMPFPGSFVLDRSDQEEIEKQKREMRPAYVRLYNLVKELLSAGPSS